MFRLLRGSTFAPAPSAPEEIGTVKRDLHRCTSMEAQVNPRSQAGNRILPMREQAVGTLIQMV
jgi:hypothetical protein